MSNMIPQEKDPILLVIAKAAQSQDVDVAKMQQLLDMHERINRQNAERAYFGALTMMQGEMPRITKQGEIKDASGRVRSKYARGEDIHDAIRGSLQKYGFALSFTTENPSPDKLLVRGFLSHRDGHRETSSIILPSDKGAGKNDVQAVGSSVSYGKRYMTCALLNIIAEGEDDDGAGGARSDEEPDVVKKLREEAKGGWEKLRIAFNALPREQRKVVQPWFEEIKADALAVKPEGSA